MQHLMPLSELNSLLREQAAALLVEGFGHGEAGGWPNLEAARAEVAAMLAPDRRAIAALQDGVLAGWVGAIIDSPHLWELHPLVVHRAYRGKGVGAMLVAAIEEAAWRDGATTMWLGSDDDFGGTNIHGVDVYADIPGAIAGLKISTRHPMAFYQRMGYTVAGIIPDATGRGKHDILMAKRLEVESETE